MRKREAQPAEQPAEPQDGTEAQDDETGAADDPEQAAPVEDVREQSSALSQQLAEQRDKYLRLAAEYDNFRRRTAKERLEASSRGQAELVTKLIDALDDLSRFAHVDPATTDPQALHKGIELVEQKALKALESAGLTIITPVDQTFDPQLHEAVMTEPALAPEDDHTVSRVFQRGYMFNGQLLRPARVVVKQWNQK